MSQKKVVEVGESMEEYIKENHIENIEKIVHQFTASDRFLQKLLEEGHDIDPNSAHIKRKDVKVGDDIDLYVKHFTEHQNFTMFLVPINFYAHAIYDTLLVSVLEVSDHWLQQKHYYADLKNDSTRSSLLSQENHDLLAEHMYHQALGSTRLDMAEVQIKLHESYMSNNTIHMGLGNLSTKEKKEFRESWGLMKKLLSHNVDLHAEMNVYIFGYDDMEIDVSFANLEKVYKITPGNIFIRHHFEEEE
ncbi:MAG: hypothetical protein JXQ96_08420 [Cyclobacteriaceae bacterium]